MKGAVPSLQPVSLLRPFSAGWWDESFREAQMMVLQQQQDRARSDDGQGIPALGFSDAPHTWMKRESHGEDGLQQLADDGCAGAARAAGERTWRGRAYRFLY